MSKLFWKILINFRSCCVFANISDFDTIYIKIINIVIYIKIINIVQNAL